MPGTQQNDLAGHLGITDDSSQFNNLVFLVSQALGRVQTNVAVKIMKVHGGGVGPAGTLDVQPLVNQIDGLGNPVPHAMVYGIPWVRNQGGANVVINDPIEGDIGIMAVHDRDISKLKATSKQANPGSFRRFNMADGVYHGPMLNTVTPNQYIIYTSTGVEIHDKNGNIIKMGPDGVDITAKRLTCNNDVIAGQGGSDQISLQQHLHINAGGSGDSGIPKAGT